ncbi:MAG: PEGA domain-containing protein [Sandaracinaceae bacterium]|nr:PEGA domain-containing protein [Sandaracinaceae bacterium]
MSSRRDGSRALLGGALALVCALAALSPMRASAQVLLVPAERDGHLADLSSVADTAATTGTSLRSHDAARDALIATHGEDPPEMSESDLARWVASSRQAVRSLARADYDSARSALAQAEAMTDRALAELNREATRSRQVLDTCLYLVRSLEETGQHSRAVEQGYACRRLVPRGEPTLTQHPPEVRAILEEVDRALAQMPGARLRVLSEPSGCAVRLNGLDFGVTPLLTEDLRPGEYRVQIECGERRGRVHRVDLTRTGAELRVDAATEAVLGTAPLRIVVPASGEIDAALVAQVSRLGRIAGATEVWLVDETGTGRRRVLSLHRIDVTRDREIAVVRTGERSIALALASLRQGRSHDWTTDRHGPSEGEAEGEGETTPTQAEEPTAAQAQARVEEQQLGVRALPPEPEPTPERVVVVTEDPERVPVSEQPPSADHTAENWVGGILIGLGVGAYAGAWGSWDYRTNYWGHRLAVAEVTDVDYLTRQSQWRDGQVLVWGLASGGAFTWALSVPLAFGPDHDVPWWSWVLGGVGLVGSGVGVAVLATTQTCSSTVRLGQPCIDAGAQQDLGFLVLAQSLPFLSFPITHLVRSVSGSDVRASASVSQDRFLIELGGTW